MELMMRYILNLIAKIIWTENQSFGSALNNFGVRELLDCFVEIAPSPRPKESKRIVDPKEKNVWICFKIHANMDQNTETGL
jgi:peptide subunit release factor RF-3